MSIQSILIILLAVIAFVVVVLYSVYFVIFIRVRRSINKNYKFREKYNLLSAKNYKQTILQITKLSNKRSQLAHVVEFINKFNDFYREQIDAVYEPIKELSNFDYHFDFQYTKKASKQISLYLDKAQSLDESFNNIKGDISAYKNNSSALVVNFKELFDDLVKFLERYILPSFDNSELLKMTNSFSSCLAKLEDASTMLMNKNLAAFIEHFLKTCPTLINTCKTYFVLNKWRIRLKYLLEEMQCSYNQLSKEQNFPYESKQRVQTIIKYTNKELNDVYDALINRNFHYAEKVMKDKFELIYRTKNELDLEIKSMSTISVIYESFQRWIEHYISNFEKLKNKLDTFILNFKKDHMLIEQIKEINYKSAQLKTLVNEINDDNKKSYSHKEYLVLISSIADNAIKLNDMIEHLIKTIADNIAVYENFLFNTNNLRLQFGMIRNYFIKNDIKNDKLYKLIADNTNELNIMESNLNKNYKENIVKFDGLHRKMERHFLEALAISIKEVELKELCQYAFMFLNKYIYESQDINNYVTDFRRRLFANGSYEECLINLITLLEKMKRAAKDNQINLF
ncbi:hypothetical protein LNO71_00140 [Mycoplasma sp. T264T]|nr:hypothetical protein [Mycoplasma bradburyae]